MQFVLECVQTLKTVVSNDDDPLIHTKSIMTDIQVRYKTDSSQRSTMLSIRKAYDGPFDSKGEAIAKEMRLLGEAHARACVQIEACIQSYGNIWKDTGIVPVDEYVKEHRKYLMPECVRELHISREASFSIARKSREQRANRHANSPLIDGSVAILHARDVVENPATHGLYNITLALLILTGRRSAELLNGRSKFEKDDANDYKCVFYGQLKVHSQKKRDCGHSIPLLAPYDTILEAYMELQRRQPEDIASYDNRSISRKYQSGLGQHLKKHVTYNTQCSLSHPHMLRGLYANACAQMFSWKTSTPQHVVQSVLLHASIEESLAYTAMRVQISDGMRNSLGEA